MATVSVKPQANCKCEAPSQDCSELNLRPNGVLAARGLSYIAAYHMQCCTSSGFVGSAAWKSATGRLVWGTQLGLPQLPCASAVLAILAGAHQIAHHAQSVLEVLLLLSEVRVMLVVDCARRLSVLGATYVSGQSIGIPTLHNCMWDTQDGLSQRTVGLGAASAVMPAAGRAKAWPWSS